VQKFAEGMLIDMIGFLN